MVRLIATRDIPAFIGLDMKEYGAFRKGRVFSVPSSTANLLIDRRLAKVTTRNVSIKRKPVKVSSYKSKRGRTVRQHRRRKPSSRGSNKERVFQIIRTHSKGIGYSLDESAPIETVLETAKNSGISTSETKMHIQSLLKSGDAFMPRHGLIKPTSKY